MKIMHPIVKIFMCLLLLPSTVHADWWSTFMETCHNLWENRRNEVVGSVAIASALAAAYCYYNGSGKSQKNRTFGSGATGRRSQVNDKGKNKTISFERPFSDRTLIIKNNVGGNVTIKSIDGNTLKVRAVKKATCLAALANTIIRGQDSGSTITTESQENEDDAACSCSSGSYFNIFGSASITINSNPSSSWGIGNTVHCSPVDFYIELPKGKDVDVFTSSGVIDVQKCQSVRAQTSNGKISIDSCVKVIAQTSNGAVSVYNSGHVTARTSNGAIDCNNCTSVQPSTLNGSITIRSTPRIHSACTSNGSITVDGTRALNNYSK